MQLIRAYTPICQLALEFLQKSAKEGGCCYHFDPLTEEGKQILIQVRILSYLSVLQTASTTLGSKLVHKAAPHLAKYCISYHN